VETGEKMKKLLNFLAEHFEWLLTEYDFKIANSEYSKTFGGEGLIRLTNSILQIDLVNDRDLTFLEFSPIKGWKIGETTSYDIIKQILNK